MPSQSQTTNARVTPVDSSADSVGISAGPWICTRSWTPLMVADRAVSARIAASASNACTRTSPPVRSASPVE